MSQQEQINALHNELLKVMERYRSEFDLSYAAVIGLFQIMSLDLYRELQENE